jgi:hypothetical protein
MVTKWSQNFGKQRENTTTTVAEVIEKEAAKLSKADNPKVGGSNPSPAITWLLF